MGADRRSEVNGVACSFYVLRALEKENVHVISTRQRALKA